MEGVANSHEWNLENFWSSNVATFFACTCCFFIFLLIKDPSSCHLETSFNTFQQEWKMNDFLLKCFTLYNPLAFCKMSSKEVPSPLRPRMLVWVIMELKAYLLMGLHLGSNLVCKQLLSHLAGLWASKWLVMQSSKAIFLWPFPTSGFLIHAKIDTSVAPLQFENSFSCVVWSCIVFFKLASSHQKLTFGGD